MRTLLTDTFLRRHQAAERTEVYDTLVPGFGVLLLPSGARTFFLRYRWRGKQPRLKLGRYPKKSLAAAREEAVEALRKVERGIDPQSERVPSRDPLTVERLAGQYLELHAKPRKRTWRQDERRIQRELVPAWGDALAGELTRQDVIALTDRIAKRAPVEANRVRALVSRIFTWAIARGVVEQNPVAGTMAPTAERPRELALTDEEIAACWCVLSAEKSPASRAYRVFLLTGAREGAVLGLRESEVVGQWATIPGERMKGGRPWRLYLGPLVREVLGEPKGGLYFPSPRRRGAPISSLSVALRRFKDGTGLDHFGHRTLRKTVATGMAALGVPPHVIDEVLSHAPKSVARRHYNLHSYDSEKRDAWLAWERRVREIVGLADEPRVVVPIR